ncbi:hypothetical protein [Desertivibrio insolitus]|uniref:hypothetical protein n=1 Tax=Herbiconiux sp. SYSU D00978 TaxID=2812562 RepID=UPI001A96C72C|nr:hypothetical protein [Herbiconiux sp. SYSU D00978]
MIEFGELVLLGSPTREIHEIHTPCRLTYGSTNTPLQVTELTREAMLGIVEGFVRLLNCVQPLRHVPRGVRRLKQPAQRFQPMNQRLRAVGAELCTLGSVLLLHPISAGQVGSDHGRGDRCEKTEEITVAYIGSQRSASAIA